MVIVKFWYFLNFCNDLYVNSINKLWIEKVYYNLHYWITEESQLISFLKIASKLIFYLYTLLNNSQLWIFTSQWKQKKIVFNRKGSNTMVNIFSITTARKLFHKELTVLCKILKLLLFSVFSRNYRRNFFLWLRLIRLMIFLSYRSSQHSVLSI